MPEEFVEYKTTYMGKRLVDMTKEELIEIFEKREKYWQCRIEESQKTIQELLS